MRSLRMRRTAVLAAAALGLAACGGGGGNTGGTATETTTGTATETTTEAQVTGRGDGTFTIARILPESGFLDYLGAPMIAGTQLAIDDINAAGGVLGQDVELLEFDSGTDPNVAGPNARSALAEGADAIIGAASSGVTINGVLPLTNPNSIPNCSPSATSGDFDTLESASMFFRTVPPDQFVAPIIINEIAADGNADNIVIVQLQDAYGDFLAAELEKAAGGQGATIAKTIKYAPDETTFTSQADEIVAADPSAVIVVGFREAAGLLKALVERDVDPSIMYGADGVFASQLDDAAGVNIDGMKVIGASGSKEFNDRLAEEGTADFLYGGQAYDCTILMALWAVAEDTDDTSAWDPQTLLDLTDGGEKCDSFESCAQILADGGDVDYDGATGPLALADPDTESEGTIGNPTVSTYAVAQFENGDLKSVSSTEVDLGG